MLLLVEYPSFVSLVGNFEYSTGRGFMVSLDHVEINKQLKQQQQQQHGQQHQQQHQQQQQPPPPPQQQHPALRMKGTILMEDGKYVSILAHGLLVWMEARTNTGQHLSRDRLERVKALGNLSKNGFGSSTPVEMGILGTTPIQPYASVAMTFDDDNGKTWTEFGCIRKMYSHVKRRRTKYSLPVYFDTDGILQCPSLHLVCLWYRKEENTLYNGEQVYTLTNTDVKHYPVTALVGVVEFEVLDALNSKGERQFVLKDRKKTMATVKARSHEMQPAVRSEIEKDHKKHKKQMKQKKEAKAFKASTNKNKAKSQARPSTRSRRINAIANKQNK